jgi:transposase
MYEIETHLAPSQEEQALLESIQGIQAMSAAVIIAEIGVDMSIFPSDTLLASWSGMRPGNRNSCRCRATAKRSNLQFDRD